jgi:hypothetical protein
MQGTPPPMKATPPPTMVKRVRLLSEQKIGASTDSLSCDVNLTAWSGAYCTSMQAGDDRPGVTLAAEMIKVVKSVVSVPAKGHSHVSHLVFRTSRFAPHILHLMFRTSRFSRVSHLAFRPHFSHVFRTSRFAPHASPFMLCTSRWPRADFRPRKQQCGNCVSSAM